MGIRHHNLPHFGARIRTIFVRILLFACLSPAASPVFAFDAAAGFAAVEEGDDLTRPAASLHMGWNKFYATRAYVWGRTFGPVKETSYLISTFRRFGLFGTKAITGSIGAAILDEYTKIEYEDDTAAEFNAEEHNYNLGAQFGLSAALVDAGWLHLSMNWDSHVFLAGPVGGIFLASGRKQTLGVLLGVEF